MTTSDDYFQISEDDWRQAEFVAIRFKPQVLQELADIGEIRSKHSKGFGFDEIHVRKRLPKPLGGATIGLGPIRKLMPASKTYHGVAFQRQRGAVPRSFAWTTGSTTLWGVVDERGNAAVLCVSLESGELTPTVTKKLTALANDHGLVFVDWVAMQTLPKL